MSMTHDSPDSVALTVNGSEVTLDPSDEVTLLHAIRAQLGLFGARPGCALGECGACTVLVDDEPVKACQVPAAEASGRSVTTPEGLGTPDAPHPLQQAFIDLQAAQCGYCINGIVMRLAAIDRAGDPVPGRDDLAAALEDQLCRCGTHARILEAAHAGLSTCRGEAAPGIGVLTTSMRSCSADGTPDDSDGVPQALQDAPHLEQWLGLSDDGRIEVLSGRAELGQGALSALRRIVAAVVGVEVDHVVARDPSTASSPDEGFTAGSRTVIQGGQALAIVARSFADALIDRAADKLGADPDDLHIDLDGVVRDDHGGELTLADLAGMGPVTGAVDLDAVPDWSIEALSAQTPRADIPRKVTGSGAYLHDLVFDGMLHARAVLPPTYEASLGDVDLTRVRAMRGVVDVVHDGRLLLVVCETEPQAIRAASALASQVRWGDEGLAFRGADVFATLRSLDTEPFVARQDDGVDEALTSGTRHSAAYSKPYQSHGVMAPSCAIARFDDDTLMVWSHTQGVFPLKRELAAMFTLDADRVTVQHAEGPGCYGQSGADDVAAFAVAAARIVPGRHVRVMLSSSDEFGWEPYGSAMAGDIDVSMDGDARILAWRNRTLTDAHMARPRGKGNRLAVAWLREDAVERSWGGSTEGGSRDSVPIYDVPAVEAIADHVRGPLRTGSLRSLGSFFHVFAIESMMDELAERAGLDPVEFRLRNLADDRAREVLEAAAEAAGWEPHVGPSGVGRGVALARYHAFNGYAALVADVDVDIDADRLAVRRVVAAVDVGTIVDPDGLRNQVEGGILQGISRTLHERLAVDGRGVQSRDWSTYPVLRFTGVPDLEILVLDRPGASPLGAGEITTPPTPAAVVNAIDDAIGVRMRHLPVDTDAIRARVLDMDEAELERIRIGE